jgi:hypothetical protein
MLLVITKIINSLFFFAALLSKKGRVDAIIATARKLVIISKLTGRNSGKSTGASSSNCI